MALSHIRYAILSLAFAALLGSCSTSTGPLPGGTTRGGAPRYLFAGTFTKGVFRSTDSGATWSPCNGGNVQFGRQWVEKMLLTANGDLIASTSSMGYFQTGDSGQTWTPFSLGFVPTAVYLLYRKGTNIYSCTIPNYLMRSTDDGTTWNAFHGGLPQTSWNACAELEGGVILAGAYNGGMWRSTDDGNTWSRADSASVGWKEIMSIIDLNGTVLASTYVNGIYRSTDKGVTWTPIPSTPPDVVSFSQVGSSLFAGGPGSIYKSTDNGGHWSTSFQLPFRTAFKSELVYSIVGSGNTVYASSDGSGIVKSTDAGATWQYTNAGLTDSNVYSLIALP